MAVKELRKLIPGADAIRLRALAATAAGVIMEHGTTVDSDTNLPKVQVATSGQALTVGMLMQKVIAAPAKAEDASDAQTAGIVSDWVFTEATPLFQEAGDRYVDEPVLILRKGLVKTNMIPAAVVPSGGQLAYVTVNGYVQNVASGASTKPVGVWQSAKDSDGYAELFVDIGRAA